MHLTRRIGIYGFRMQSVQCIGSHVDWCQMYFRPLHAISNPMSAARVLAVSYLYKLQRLCGLLIPAALLSLPQPVQAQTPAGFYRGRDVHVLISHPPGGGYDVYARLYARHLSRHLAGNPNVIAQNMPGAAGLVMANFIYSRAPVDGATVGLGPGSTATAALFEAPGARYDARRFNWIGSLNSEVAVAIAWHESPVKTARDLFETELVVAAAGNTDQSVVYPRALNKILGAKFKIIAGYAGSPATAFAVERGEASGIGGMNYSTLTSNRPDWLREKKINILLQMALDRHPDMQDIPTVLELARNDEERAVLRLVFAQSAIGRVIFAPPAMPADRVTALRAAFDAIVRDAQFLAEAEKQRMEINQPRSGEEIAALIEDLHKAPAHLTAQARSAVAGETQ